MGKLYELIIQPIANVIDRVNEKRSNAVQGIQTEKTGVEDQSTPKSTWVKSQQENSGVSAEELSRREEECVSCKIIIMTSFVMYGTAILLIPTTEKYKMNMRKYLKNKNTVMGIFVVHSALGAACFGGAFYQAKKLKEILDRRKEAEE
ncbi:uncharacterized protein LOC111128474 isoform X2 [Crassostrea virginica]